MRDDDIVGLEAWAVATGAQEPTAEDDEAAEAALQRLGRDRLVAMWRAALDSVAAVAEAERERDRREQADAAPAAWVVPPAGDGQAN